MALLVLDDVESLDEGGVELGRPALLILDDSAGGDEGGVRFSTGTYAGSDITADLVHPDDPSFVLAPLTLTRDRQWLEQLSDAGNASITIVNDDAYLGDVVEGSLVRLSLAGVPAVVMVCETQDAVLIAEGEEADETTTWSGRLHVSLLDRAVIDPSRGVLVEPVQENRAFDYTDSAFDDRAWGSPAVLGALETARYLHFFLSDFVKLFADTPNDIARNYPDPFTALLWAPGGTLLRGRPVGTDAGGDCYHREWFTAPTTGDYELHGVCDDTAEYFIDGVSVLAITEGNFASTGSAGVELTAGRHLLAIHGHNRKDSEIAWALNPDGVFNPGFFGWSLFHAGVLNTDGFVAHSTGAGKFAAYAAQTPGMTIGRALRLVRDEARARGALMPELGFTDLVDSAGRPWPYAAISTRVGTSMFTFLRELADSLIDFRMRAGTFTLDAWNYGTLGVERAIPFEDGTLRRLERKGGEPISNSALVRTAYGWDRVERTSSIVEHGRREFEYALGAQSSLVEVDRLTNARLDIISEPRYQWDATHDPANRDDWAYTGYGMGDRVPLTEPGGDPVSRRVVSISVSETDDVGDAMVVTTLGDVVMYASPIENFVAMLGQAVRKMIPGTGMGDWPEAQPATPPAVPTPIRGSRRLSPFLLTATWQETADPPAIDFNISAPSAEYVWLLHVIHEGATISLLTEGAAAFASGTPASYDTAPFRMGAPGSQSNRQIIAIVLRYGEGLIGGYNSPDLTHPDLDLEGGTVPFNFGENFSHGELDSFLAGPGPADPGEVAPMTITFNDTDTTAVAWMVFAIDGATWHDYNLASGTGDGTIGGVGSADEGYLACLAVVPAFAPSFSDPWGEHTAAVQVRG